MNLEEKIAVYVKDYGENAEDQLKKKGSSRDWRVIKDSQLFAESIFCSCICGEEWRQKDFEIIIKLLDSNVWYFEPEAEAWIIEQVLRSLNGKVDEDAIYLKLAYIALLGDGKTRPFIRALMDIFYYKKSKVQIDAETLNILSQQIGAKWDEEIMHIFVVHFGNNLKCMSYLKVICMRHKTFIENKINMSGFTFR